MFLQQIYFYQQWNHHLYSVLNVVDKEIKMTLKDWDEKMNLTKYTEKKFIVEVTILKAPYDSGGWLSKRKVGLCYSYTA